MLPTQHRCQINLQVALDKHCDDILCLLRAKSPSKQGAILHRMLTKIRKVSMGTMVKINDSVAQAGGKALTVMKLKELGSKAEREARRLYNNLGDGRHPTHPDRYHDTSSPAHFSGPPGH